MRLLQRPAPAPAVTLSGLEPALPNAASFKFFLPASRSIYFHSQARSRNTVFQYKMGLKWRKKMAHRLIKPLSLLLGVWMVTFGFLKFFQPVRGWFDVQVQQSHLPHEAILAGKLTEMLTGALFILPWVWKSLTAKSKIKSCCAPASSSLLKCAWQSMSTCSPGCLPASFLSVSSHQ